MKPSLSTRISLGLASVALGILLIVNLKAPEDIAIAGGSSGGSGTTPTSGGSTSGGSTSGGSTPRPNATSGGTTSGGTTSGGTTTGTKTLTGTLIETRYGPVEVVVTITNGKIVSVTADQLPSDGRSGEISAYVEPILSGEAMAAQSATIDLVSGATYTSTGYATSLQAALDQAGL
jgi:uncharacterized protein with FMN-binding domain